MANNTHHSQPAMLGRQQRCSTRNKLLEFLAGVMCFFRFGAYSMNKVIAFIVLLSFPCISVAKVASIEWKELIEYSDVIAFVEVKSIHRVDLANGFTEVQIAKLLKGAPNSEILKVHWELSTISIPITDILSDYVLFLRLRDDGSYEPSVSSKSVWRFETVNFRDKGQNYIDLELGLSMIESIPEDLYSLVQSAGCNNYVSPFEVKRIRLENLVKYFNDKRHLNL